MASFFLRKNNREKGEIKMIYTEKIFVRSFAHFEYIEKTDTQISKNEIRNFYGQALISICDQIDNGYMVQLKNN